MSLRIVAILIAAVWLNACSRTDVGKTTSLEWTASERSQISSMGIGRLGPPPNSSGNPVADDPAAAKLGQKLFSDPRLSRNGHIACITCHQPERGFTDGKPTAEGLAPLERNAPSLIGAAYSPWQFWDGRSDSLWSQALVPLENPKEMGFTRTELVGFWAQNYRTEYESLFGPLPAQALNHAQAKASPEGLPAEQSVWKALPAVEQEAVNHVLVNFGRVMEAYVRTLLPPETRFDKYAKAVGQNDALVTELLSQQEERGLKLFLGKGQCLRCHAGPLFTTHGFHNTGLLPLAKQSLDRGRDAGVHLLLTSPFNCRSPYSAATDKSCPNLEFISASGPELSGAFKAPSLRGLTKTGPYMHDGRFSTLGQVLEHYNQPPVIDTMLGHSEVFPLHLSGEDLAALEAFLKTLSPAGGDAGQSAFLAESGKK